MSGMTAEVARRRAGDRVAMAGLRAALQRLPCDPELVTRAAARHVDRLWRQCGAPWQSAEQVDELLEGVAELAWKCTSENRPASLLISVTLQAHPHCIRVRLPNDSRYCGLVMLWLRHFEALLPPGAPVCDLVLRPCASPMAASALQVPVAECAIEAAVDKLGPQAAASARRFP